MITKADNINRPDSIPVTNNSKILGIIVDLQMKAFEDQKISLSRNLSNQLTVIFGKNTSSFTSEFRHKIWTLKYKDLLFNIFCSNGGTNIEICNFSHSQINKGESESDIIEFLNELYKLINK